MEQNTEKVSNGALLNMKQNHATQCAEYQKEASCSVLAKWPSLMSPAKKLSKRRRLHGHKSKISELRSYLNYRKSGMPKHLLFYQNDEWINFPEDVIDPVRNDLRAKKAVVEVTFNGHNLVIDFLHMYQMDLKTGLQQPIAWIDDTRSCFFPEVSTASDEESYDFCKQEHGNVHTSSFPETNGSSEIKCHLGIKPNGLDESKLKECSGDYDALANNVQIDPKVDCGQFDVEAENSDNKIDQGKAGEELNLELGLGTCTKPVNGKLDLDSVKKMFAKGMGSFGTFDIVEIIQCSSSSLQDRLELFEKQIEITKKCRGHANVHYAWLASSKEELAPVINYGFGYCGVSARKSKYGMGVHLSSANYAYTSVNHCDVDEDGLRHMVLCRVIMGNMELLRLGSKQFHPSSNEYDNGVDDIRTRHYVVWSTNANTHIYPEFVVSFKASPELEDYLAVMEKMRNVSRVTGTDYEGPLGLMHSESSEDMGSSSTPVSGQAPKSVWLPVHTLLSAVSNKVSPREKELLYAYFEEFRLNKISLNEIIGKVRLLVGDSLLRSAIALLQYNTNQPT